ncbi:MAG: phosphopantetheine-binding protein [Pirellulales bacterium]|nr:phosphopantetheine-binding protein [Pirellulales bacterium]
MSAASSSPDGVRLFLEARVSDWLPDQTLEALGLDSLDLAQIRADTTQLGPKLPPLAYFADADRTLGELAVLLRDHFSLQ